MITDKYYSNFIVKIPKYGMSSNVITYHKMHQCLQSTYEDYRNRFSSVADRWASEYKIQIIADHWKNGKTDYLAIMARLVSGGSMNFILMDICFLMRFFI